MPGGRQLKVVETNLTTYVEQLPASEAENPSISTQISIDRKVALKILPPAMVSRPEQVERFLHEAQISSNLQHPNIVTLLESGRIREDGVETPYLVYELVEGVTLPRAKGGLIQVGPVHLEITNQTVPCRRMEEAQVPGGPVLALEDIPDNPQIEHNKSIYEVEHPTAGHMRQCRPAPRFSRTQADAGPVAPLIGEHTEEVLREVGYTSDDFDAMRASGAIG